MLKLLCGRKYPNTRLEELLISGVRQLERELEKDVVSEVVSRCEGLKTFVLNNVEDTIDQKCVQSLEFFAKEVITKS